MIEEQAQVIEINGEQLLLQVLTKSTCGSCVASSQCGTSLLSKVVGRKFTQFHAANSVNAQVGDTVIVGIPEDALLKGSLMMYAVPIFGMLSFALLFDYLLANGLINDVLTAATHDLAVAASGIMGLFLGSLVAKWYFQRDTSVSQFAPVVLRTIAPSPVQSSVVLTPR